MPIELYMTVNSITYGIVTIITININALIIIFIVMFFSHSMSNIPEIRIYLVRTQGFIEQVLKVFEATFIYNEFNARNAVILLTNIAQCKEAQQYLLQEEIIDKVYNSASERKKFSILVPALEKPQRKLIK